MTRQVTLNEAQTHLSDLVEAAKKGETIFIAENDHPVVQLVRVAPTKRRAQFGSAKGLLRLSDDFDAPLPDFNEYTR
jgi:prevent-host-death family protein